MLKLLLVLPGVAQGLAVAGTASPPDWVLVGETREIDASSVQRTGDVITYQSRDNQVSSARYRVVANCLTFERQEIETSAPGGAKGELRATGPDMEHRREVEAACRLTGYSPSDTELAVPEGYKVVRLEAIDGRIVIPADWTVRQLATRNSLLWLFAKDFRSDGSYATGMTLQLFPGIKKNSGSSVNEAANTVLDTIRRHGKVVRDCATQRFQEFERHCLEMLEERAEGDATRVTYHVLYSVLVHLKYDVVVVTAFGAPASSWDDVAPITRVMSDFRLFGPEFARKAQK
jgi:hypothetical protein